MYTVSVLLLYERIYLCVYNTSTAVCYIHKMLPHGTACTIVCGKKTTWGFNPTLQGGPGLIYGWESCS